VSYLSDRYRVSRGNKGTVFLLEKVVNLSMDARAQFAMRRLDTGAVRASSNENSSPTAVVAAAAVKTRVATTLPSAREDSSPSTGRRRVADSSSSSNLSTWPMLGEWVTRLSAATAVAASSISKNAFKSSTAAISSSKRIAIIFPAQLGTKDDYKELETVLSVLSNGTLTAYTAPLQRINWPVSALPLLINPPIYGSRGCK